MRPLLAVMLARGPRRTTTRRATTRLATTRLATTPLATTPLATTRLATTRLATTRLATTLLAATLLAATRLATTLLAATLLAATLLAGCMFHPGDDTTDTGEPGGPPGGSPETPPGQPPEGNPPAGVKRVFVTRGTYSGALTSYIAASSGLAAADSICELRAAAAGLGGEWVAWLSSSQQDAIERVTAAGPWQRLDGKVAFTGRAQLYGEPHVALDLDEHGAQADAFGDAQVWTGTKAGGLRHADTCADWTTATGMGRYGRRATTFDWTDEYSAFCEQPMRLICLEN